MVFADINLSNEPDFNFRHTYQPGNGGWPTIRYFNKDTGHDGAPYTQRTKDSVCDELGKVEYMRAYVEHVSGVPSCDVISFVGCSEQDTQFIHLWTLVKTREELIKEAAISARKLHLTGKKAPGKKAKRKMLMIQRIHARLVGGDATTFHDDASDGVRDGEEL